MNEYGLLKLKKDVDLLIRKVDPKSGEFVGDDSILSSEYNRGILICVSNLLDEMITAESCNYKLLMKALCSLAITAEDMAKIKISEKAISISELTYSINDVIEKTVVEKIKATLLTTWLTENKFLKMQESEDGTSSKVVTEEGKELGIESVIRESKYGKKYHINLYNKNAQKFIVESLNEILIFRLTQTK